MWVCTCVGMYVLCHHYIHTYIPIIYVRVVHTPQIPYTWTCTLIHTLSRSHTFSHTPNVPARPYVRAYVHVHRSRLMQSNTARHLLILYIIIVLNDLTGCIYVPHVQICLTLCWFVIFFKLPLFIISLKWLGACQKLQKWCVCTVSTGKITCTA